MLQGAPECNLTALSLLPTLIRELIDSKERVDKDDFVLKLNEGVAEASKALADYVVTTDLVANFDDALGLIKGEVECKKSRGTYLHGSFASGKSQFMEVLNLLLKGNADTRALPRLAPVVTNTPIVYSFAMVPSKLATDLPRKHSPGSVLVGECLSVSNS